MLELEQLQHLQMLLCLIKFCVYEVCLPNREDGFCTFLVHHLVLIRHLQEIPQLSHTSQLVVTSYHL